MKMEGGNIQSEDNLSKHVKQENSEPGKIEFTLESTIVKSEECIESFVNENQACLKPKGDSSNIQIKCHLCQMPTESGEHLFYHMKAYHPIDWVTCEFCTKKYRVLASMKHHVRRMHKQGRKTIAEKIPNHFLGLKKKQVILAGQPFSDKLLPQINESTPNSKHMSTINKSQIKPSHQRAFCEKCQQWFARKWVLKNHMELHNKNTYKICELCNKVLPNTNTYKNHSSRIKICQICSTKICRFADFQQHLLFHEVKTNLICKSCNASFDFKRNLRQHEQQHKEEGIIKPFSCIRCDNMLQTVLGATGCERRHTGKFRCNPCNINFITPAELTRHTDKAHNENRKLYICTICHSDPSIVDKIPNRTTTFSKESALQNHMKKIHTGDTDNFICHICSKHFTSIDSMTRHFKAIHPDDWQKCKHCDLQFRAKPTLEDHMKRAHADKYEFLECHVCFKLFANVNTHMKEEHPGIFVKCKYVGCSSMMRSKEKLNEHMHKIHKLENGNNETNTKCRVCNKMFKNKAVLVKHSVSHTNKKDLECPKCPFKANKSFIILSHIKSHNKDIPFPCDKCPKKFRSQTTFTRHYKVVHLEMEGFILKIKCLYCDYRSEKSYMKLHERGHTGEKPYKCPKCKLRFTRSWCLNMHCRNVHKYSNQDLVDAGMYTENTIHHKTFNK